MRTDVGVWSVRGFVPVCTFDGSRNVAEHADIPDWLKAAQLYFHLGHSIQKTGGIRTFRKKSRGHLMWSHLQLLQLTPVNFWLVAFINPPQFFYFVKRWNMFVSQWSMFVTLNLSWMNCLSYLYFLIRMFSDADIYFCVEVTRKKSTFTKEPWCFAICINCLEKCIHCFANYNSDLRNVSKWLWKTVRHENTSLTQLFG